jgi:hypothetical protein
VGRRGSATAARPDPAERSGRHLFNAAFNARDLVRDLDRLRGRTDKSKFLRRLLRAEAKRAWPTWPVDDDDDEEDGPVVSDETLERLRRLTTQ